MAARGYGAPDRFLPVSTSKVWSKEEQLVERREQFLLQELKVSQELEVLLKGIFQRALTVGDFKILNTSKKKTKKKVEVED